jgi:hypothetical protein
MVKVMDFVEKVNERVIMEDNNDKRWSFKFYCSKKEILQGL